MKKALAAAIEKQVEEKQKEKLKASEEDNEEDEKIKSYIMSLIKSSKSSNSIAESTKTIPKPATTSAVTFRSILKKVKNQKWENEGVDVGITTTVNSHRNWDPGGEPQDEGSINAVIPERIVPYVVL